MNDYEYNLHEMIDRLHSFVSSLSSFQVYQFINLNPFLIDDDELKLVNDRDEFKDLYDESIDYEESKSSMESEDISSC